MGVEGKNVKKTVVGFVHLFFKTARMINGGCTMYTKKMMILDDDKRNLLLILTICLPAACPNLS